MATIYYSMAGEGRGHATRVKAIVDDLMQRHRVVLYAPGEAWDLLHPTYRDSSVEVRHMEGVRNYLGFPSHLYRIRKDMELERPQLVITDFDPLLPRAAEQLGIPYLSINHQHFLRTYDLSSLPLRLRCYAAILGWGVRCFYGSQKALPNPPCAALGAHLRILPKCPGCWAECEILPSALYSGDLLRAL